MTEFEFDMDPTTGMPETPEGYVWYVTDDHLYLMLVSKWSEEKTHVQLSNRSKTELGKTGTDNYYTQHSYGYSPPTTLESVHEEDAHWEIIAIRNWRTLWITRYRRQSKTRTRLYTVVAVDAASTPVSKENLYARARVTLKTWRDERNAIIERKELRGFYPPNRLDS